MTDFQNLLNFGIQLAEALLAPLVAPFLLALAAYNGNVNSEMLIIDRLHPNGYMTQAEAAALWSALLGTVFVLGVALAIALGVALAIISGLTLGTSFVVTILVSLAITAALVALSFAGGVNSAESFSTFSGRPFVNSVQSLATNVTGHAPGNLSTPNKTVSQKDQWAIFGGLFALTVDLAIFPLGVGLLYPVLFGTNTASQYAAAVISFVLAFVGLAFYISGVSGAGGCLVGHPSLAVGGIIFGLIGLAAGAYGLKGGLTPTPPALKQLSEFSLVLSVLSFEVGLAENIKECY